MRLPAEARRKRGSSQMEMGRHDLSLYVGHQDVQSVVANPRLDTRRAVDARSCKIVHAPNLSATRREHDQGGCDARNGLPPHLAPLDLPAAINHKSRREYTIRRQ